MRDGSADSSRITALSQSFTQDEVASDIRGCFKGADVKLDGGPGEFSLVAVFDDFSVLHMLKDDTSVSPSFACVDTETSRFYAQIQLKFSGGFGRFEEATGKATLRLTGSPVGMIPVGIESDMTLPSGLISEVGTINGVVQVK